MCRLFLIFNENNRDERVNKLAIAMSIKSYEIGNDDGFGYAVLKPKSLTPEIEKTLSISEYIKKITKLDFSYPVMLHLRQATTGRISVRNSHPFYMNRKVFAHNGIVSKYSKSISPKNWWYGRGYYETYAYPEKDDEDLTDSEQFFLKIVDYDDLSDIEKEVRNSNFSGVAFMYNYDLNELIIIATRTWYIGEFEFEDKKKIYVLSSWDDVFKNLKSVKVEKIEEEEVEILFKGLKVKRKRKKKIKIVDFKYDKNVYEIKDGIYRIDLNNYELKEVKKIEEKVYSYSRYSIDDEFRGIL